MYNLSLLLVHQAKCMPDHYFLVKEDVSYSYIEWERHVNDIASHLVQRGAVQKCKIIIDCSDEWMYVSVLFAVWRIGAIAIPINSQHTAVEKETLNRIVEAEYVITDSIDFEWVSDQIKVIRTGEWKPAEEIMAVCPVAPDDVAEILFTSGSSGTPKGVMLTHSNILMNAIESVHSLALTYKDIQFVTVPLMHAFGQNRAVISSVYAGASIYVASRLGVRQKIEVIERVNPTVIIALPSYYSMLNASKPVLSRIRTAVSASAPLSPATQAQFEEIYGAPLLVGYGLSECSPVITAQTLDTPRAIGSVGKAIRGVEIRILDEDGNIAMPKSPGSIQVRGHNVMKGYYGRPLSEGFYEPEWFNTNDIGTLDEEGNLFLLGRESGFIKRFGYKVFPIEIQNVLLTHPAIMDATVAKINRQATGEDLVAYVKLKNDANITQRDLIEFCKHVLAAHKIPTRIDIVDEIQTLPSGKPMIVSNQNK